MTIKREAFDPRSLELVRRAPSAIPAYVVGDMVKLRSGGPTMLVVDVVPGKVTAALPREQFDFPPICLERAE